MPEENPTPSPPADSSNHQVQTVVMENGNPWPTGAFTTGIEPEN
jgi:hypothetical protein|tara:strand:+ start:121 stop:252 length:132 start_codon:yes stop_codon:yes gene_type:complete